MKRTTILFGCILVLLFSVSAQRPPLMGWASWNHFHMDISDPIIRQQADALVSSGLKDAGYTYINIDDGFFDNRNADGSLRINAVKFPNGMKAVVNYIHSKGLKAGFYSEAGSNTCGSMYDNAKGGIGGGLYKHEQQDIDLFFKEWDFDFLKVDYCGGLDQRLDEETRYTAIRKAIDRTGISGISLNVCRWQFPGTWVTRLADSWRIWTDIRPDWNKVCEIIDKNTYLAPYASPGHYNDMDMLEVGRGMSSDEDKAHFSMWCLLGSPLLLGNDLSNVSPSTMEIIANREIIAINQDISGDVQGRLLSESGKGLQIWGKRLQGKQSALRAVVLLNRNNQPQTITVNWSMLDLEGPAQVRDLWTHQDLGELAEGYTAEVPAHGAVVLRVNGRKNRLQESFEAEYAWLNHFNWTRFGQIVPGQGSVVRESRCSGGAKAVWLGNSVGNFIEFKDIIAEQSGNYQLTLHYICSQPRDVDVFVNGSKTHSLKDLTSNDWKKAATTTITVRLRKGENSIRFVNSKNWMPDFDRIQLNLNTSGNSVSGGPTNQKALQTESLRTEWLVNPEGLNTLTPRFSWNLSGTGQDIRQTAWQIRAAKNPNDLTSGRNLWWDSGKIPASDSHFVPYQGRSLKSRDRIHWQVKAFTATGETEWSKVASFSIGLMDETDWMAHWIGLDKTFRGDNLSKHSRLSARYLRKEFQVEDKMVENATLYICGLGQYEAFMNGVKTGDYVLAPTLSDYTKSALYNTYDLTNAVKQGKKNTLAVVLGNGRFFSSRFEGGGKMRNFGFPKMISQLEIQYKDGSLQVVSSDETWKLSVEGPIRANNEFDGEEYDARMEFKDWMNTGFDDHSWRQAERVKAPAGRLEAQVNRNIKIMQTLDPVKRIQQGEGKVLLDMGQNMVGWLQLNVRAQKDDTITLRFAETRNSDGNLYTANLRSALATDRYVCKGTDEEQWEPSFVYHGFRYVEISCKNDFRLGRCQGKVVYDDLETIGSFTCSDSTLNQLYRNAYWGIRGNYRSIPTDCPQRDERQGWLGDRTTGALGESFLFNNHDLYAKWLNDIEQAQRADGNLPDVAPTFWNWSGFTDNITWPGAYITVADLLYRQFGDEQPIAKHYDSMKKWLGYMKSNFLKNGIMTKDKYGDWCVPPESPSLIHSKDSSKITDGALIGTAYYYRMLDLMEGFASLLKNEDDAARFTSEMDTVLGAFNARFFDPVKNQYGNNTVTANFLPLCFGMIPKQHETAVFNQIANRISGEYKGHVSSGLVGIQWLMRGLTDHGRGDLALKIATNRDYPSWGYMIENGATTIWELWNGNTADPAMNSGNHVMLLGDLLIWFYQNLAGIRQSEGSSAYRQIELKPDLIDGLDFVNASYKTPNGLIVSNWKKTGKTLQWDIVVPANTTAKVYLPTDNGFETKEYGSGSYHLESHLNYTHEITLDLYQP